MGRLPITPGQRRRLQHQLDTTPDARLFRRTLAVLLFDQGRPATEIADLLRVTRQSVYHWRDTYLRTGRPEALADDERAGRPRQLGDDETALLRELLCGSPQQWGFPDASWTVPRLREALLAGTGVRFADSTVRRALRRLDYLWKRPRYRLAPDPERDKKTPPPQADPGPAAAHRAAGRGRDGPVALPAPAGRLVAARRGGRGAPERPQRPPGDLRRHEPADGDPAVAAAPEGAQR